MDDLRFFRAYNTEYHLNSSDCYENKLHGFEELESFPSDITFFSWNSYPFKSVPLNFPSESLVRLDMPNSKVKHWKGVQDLVNLKYVDLSYSKHMTEIPNLSRASNLKELRLLRCSSLLKIAPSSIRNLTELAMLDLGGCTKLISLPDGFGKLKSLKYLDLYKCSKLERLPDDFGDLKALETLRTGDTVLKEVPSSILHLPKMDSLYLYRPHDNQTPLNWVLISSSDSSSLTTLDLENCRITKLPDNLRQLSSLLTLNLRRNNFESIPNLRGLSYLSTLDISNCRRLQLLPELPMGVSVCASNCLSLQSISDPSFLLLPLWRQRASIFVNCFELDLPKILHEESCREFCADIIFPGNEIPKWFTFQNTGSYIALDQPLDWHNKNFLGFLASVVLPPSSYEFPYYAAICYCLVKSKNGKQQIYSSNIQSDYFAFGRFCSEDAWSDHVVLSFHSINKMTFKKCEGEYHEIYSEMKSLNCKVLIKFIARHKGVKKCGIQKCGIHFLYVGAYGEPSETSRRSVDNAKKKGKEKDELQSNKLQISNPFDGICSLRPHFMSKSPYDNPNIFKSCLEERYWKLKRNALRETVKNALLSFQQSTTLCSEIEEMNCVNPKGCMSFPGSEIPEWFSFQNASYNIKLSSGSFHDAIDTCHNPFAGLAFCTVVEFPDLLDLGQPFFVYCMMDIKYLNDPYETFAIGSIKGWFEGDRTHYIKSDHVFLGYDCVMYSGETRTLFNHEVEINFVVTTYDMVPIEGCKVKKCGVHLLCPEDYKWKDLIDLSSLKRKLKLNGNGRYNDEPPSDDFSAACNCQFKSSATSLDLNEMLDTTEPLSKRLKVCNYKNKEIEVAEGNPSTSQPTGFADSDSDSDSDSDFDFDFDFDSD
ncbi:disease resistance protein RPP2B-like [Pistacia vera]|uniref:disease resistance protein RPP2B-like n=1 Tax=Pistacia vera TaxID=55513 RepID=UPI001263DCFD|nr:disease resistance protein RPP2B-like [Pistacia vera]